MKRLHRSAGVMLVYWVMLVGGLALFTFSRIEDAHALQGVWLGLLLGTAIGHLLGLRDVRWGGAFLIVLLSACWFVAIIPADVAGGMFAKVFVAAGLCAYWSLGDRGSLTAFWFPTMIWMLSILDRTGPSALPDRTGLILLGALAVMFLVFLRAREARRIALWQTVAVEPLATAKPATVLKEHPGNQLARASWMLAVGAGAFAVTAWLAPKLWKTESSAGDLVGGEVAHGGRPCCPVDGAPAPRVRVKEYLNLGLGHDAAPPEPIPGVDCQVCEGDGEMAIASASRGGHYVPSGAIEVTGTIPAGTYYDTPGWIRTVSESGATTWTRIPDPTETTLPGTATPVEGGSPVPSGAIASGAAPSGVAPMPSTAPASGASPSAPGPSPLVPAAPPPASPNVASILPKVPPTAPPPTTKPAPARPATVEPSSSSSTSIDGSEPATAMQPSRPTEELGGGIVRWLILLAACAAALKAVALALRPLRRMVTLRHLREPYWTETVDQRISNYWQLALIGLRDAGWRATSSEEPRAFAARVNVEGLERCAVILERARHGLGVDAEDLAEMGAAADAAYTSARAPLGTLAKAGAAVRWPLA